VTEFDLERYLKRIGLENGGERPSAKLLARLHRAHVTTIPFENLDPHRGVPVSLERGALFDKLVSRRRGGYCFEQNLLFTCALESLGFDVAIHLARVRTGLTPGAVRPRSHLVVRVLADESLWQADVGFGRGALLEPIRWGPGGPWTQSGWRFRVVQDGGDEYVLQAYEQAEWRDQYSWEPRPVPLVDVEVSNWHTCTHPSSRFVTGLIVARHDASGARVALSDWDGLTLTQQTPERTVKTPVTLAEVPSLLAACFGLRGFRVRQGRIALTDDELEVAR
jgi:N-hydroxyarylamine O-acetyltransferase